MSQESTKIESDKALGKLSVIQYGLEFQKVPNKEFIDIIEVCSCTRLLKGTFHTQKSTVILITNFRA